MDQAATLRNISRNGSAPAQAPKPTHILTVSSGKGGVGKSNFVLNVAIALRKYRKRVLILDADMALGNIDILLGQATRYNLSHVLNDEKTIDEVMAQGPAGIDFLPAASGVEWMTNLSVEQKLNLLEKMDALNGRYDILLIDTGAGIASNVVYFNIAAQTRIVIVTPEPTSLTDAYALIKVLNRTHHQKTFEVVVNSVSSEKEGLDVYRSLTAAADRFLDVHLSYMGHINADSHLGQAVLQQTPVIELYPDASISERYRALARRISQMPADPTGGELGVFWRKMVKTTPR